MNSSLTNQKSRKFVEYIIRVLIEPKYHPFIVPSGL